MPIKNKNKKRYPDNWKAISRRIRFERAGGVCEQCGVVYKEPHPTNGKPTILTVAHLDHNPENNEDSNLMSMCCPCHLAYDLEHHMQNARETRLQKLVEEKRASGQLSLWPDDS